MQGRASILIKDQLKKNYGDFCLACWRVRALGWLILLVLETVKDLNLKKKPEKGGGHFVSLITFFLILLTNPPSQSCHPFIFHTAPPIQLPLLLRLAEQPSGFETRNTSCAGNYVNGTLLGHDSV